MSTSGPPDKGGADSTLNISSSTTLKISWGLLIAVLGYAGVGTWQFFEMRQVDRDKIKNISDELNRRIDTAERRFESLSSDVNYWSKQAAGQFQRVDRMFDTIQELSIFRHRLSQGEMNQGNMDRRMAGQDTKIEELQRRTAEHTIVIEYIMRWVPGDPPARKRNNSPFGHFRDDPTSGVQVIRPVTLPSDGQSPVPFWAWIVVDSCGKNANCYHESHYQYAGER